MSRRPYSFKSDTSFLEKLSLGANGTKRTLSILDSFGHKMIELEKNSLSADIWKDVKVKRLRVPDLVVICQERTDSDRFRATSICRK